MNRQEKKISYRFSPIFTSKRSSGTKTSTQSLESQTDCNAIWSVAFTKLCELEDTVKSLLKKTRSLERRLEEFLAVIYCWESRQNPGLVKGRVSVEALSREEETIRMKLFSDLDSICRMLSRHPLFILNQKPDGLPASLFPWEHEISVVVDGECLYVKTPPLFNRNKHWCGRGCVDYFELFAPIVEQKMQENILILPQYTEKNIQILFVEPPAQSLPDADNMDTKKVIDAITKFLPGGDSGTCCSFSLASIYSKNLSPGAYFTVTRGFAASPEFEENIRQLIRIFG